MVGDDVRDALDLADQPPAGRHHLAAQALAHPNPRTDHRLRRRAGETGEDEVLAVEQPEAGVVHVEEPRRLVGDRREQRLRRRHAPDLRVDLEERAEVRASGAFLRVPAGVVDRVRGVEGERGKHAELLAGVLVSLAHADRQRPEHPVADQEWNDRGRRRALRTELLDVARARVVEDVGHRQGLTRGDNRSDEPLADADPAWPLHRRPRADRRPQRDVLTVVLDEPEPRDARVEQLAAASTTRWSTSSSDSVAVSVCASRVSVSRRRVVARVSPKRAARATAWPTWWATACRSVSSSPSNVRGSLEISAMTPQIRSSTVIGSASWV